MSEEEVARLSGERQAEEDQRGADVARRARDGPAQQRLRPVRSRDHARQNGAPANLGTAGGAALGRTPNEALLKAKQLAEKANAFKSSFLAFVSHDLLQPLNAARLNLSTLTEAAPSDEVRRFARQIDLALTNLEDLIRTLLDMSKLDAGAMRPDLACVELEQILSTLRLEFAPIAAARGLKLTIRPSHAYVRTDPLLINAFCRISSTTRCAIRGAAAYCSARACAAMDSPRSLRHRPRHSAGPARSDLRRVPTRRRRRRRRWRLRARPVDRAPPRASARSSHRPFLARRIRLDLRPRLPRADPADAAPTPAGVPLPARLGGVHGAEILVIENEHSVAAAMRALLERWGCRVSVAGSPGEAREAVRRGAAVPDLVIADYHLDDGEHGFDAIDLVQKKSTWRSPPASSPPTIPPR